MLQYVIKAIFVSRSDADSRQQCKEEILRRINSGDDWPQLLIFPEGTTTNRKRIISFKHGAFSPGVPVQPVLIKYNNRLNTMVWADNGLKVLIGLYLTVCQFHNSVEIEYLPVHYPSEEEKADALLYAGNVKKELSLASNIPMSEHSFTDTLICRQAVKLGLPYSSAMTEFSKYFKPLGVSMDDLIKLLRRFAAMNTSHSGCVTMNELATFLRVPCDACLRAVYETLDKDGSAELSFFHYSLGIIKYSRPLLQDEVLLQQIFDFFDQDGDGLVTKTDFSRLPFTSTANTNNNNHDAYTCETGTVHTSCGCSSRRNQTERGEAVMTLFDFSGPWNFDQFKELLSDNLEYLLLFHECQNAGISNPKNQ